LRLGVFARNKNINLKKVLIITYYWPPSGGAGVQRWLKFVKYLREFGWEPVVYTAENPEMPSEDPSLFKDIPENLTVIKQPVWEPYNLYKKFTGSKAEKINAGFLSENKKPKLTQKVAVWVRGNFFIPDARKFWINPSVQFLSKYLQENQVDAIVSTGPPHSMHLIALKLKEKFNIPWLADFRDPWTNIDYYDQLMLSGWADRLHKRLEKKVIENSDALVVVGNTMKEEFDAMGAKNIKVITNGFDKDDIPTAPTILDLKFTIVHTGSFVKTRNPQTLWKAIAEVKKSDSSFWENLQIKLVGKVDVDVMESLKQYGLAEHVLKIDYVQHDEVMKIQQSAQVLLLCLNNTRNAKGILTGKMFEYIASHRPVLCIGPEDSDGAVIIKGTGAGYVADFDDEKRAGEIISNLYSKYKSGNLNVDPKGIEQYSRRELTGKLAVILDGLIKKN
jgi:glycosyltransferase involved in cell wall biosynthesis